MPTISSLAGDVTRTPVDEPGLDPFLLDPDPSLSFRNMDDFLVKGSTGSEELCDEREASCLESSFLACWMRWPDWFNQLSLMEVLAAHSVNFVPVIMS